MVKVPPKHDTLLPLLSPSSPRVRTIGLADGEQEQIRRLLDAAEVTAIADRDVGVLADAIAHAEPDLVLIDLKGEADFQLVRYLKTLPETHFVPIIASSDEPGRRHAYAAGLDHWCPRPLVGDPDLAVRASALMRSAGLSRALRSSRQELRMRRDWVRYLVHDLRNLLSAPLASLTLITRKRITEPREVDVMTTQIEHDLWRAATLLNDLLDVDRIRKGVLTARRTEVDLVDLARRVSDGHRDVAARGSVALEVAAGASTLCAPIDAPLVERVLSNLISNALRYAPADTPITVTVRRQDSVVQLAVENRGPIIPPDQIAHIFEPFVRVDHDERPLATGAGLGLAFCRLAVDMHGGRIGVVTPEDGGARFWFTLPLEETEA